MLPAVPGITTTGGLNHVPSLPAGYPEGHPTVIKKVEAGRELSASEAKRLVKLDDGEYVCSDEVRAPLGDVLRMLCVWAVD